MSKTMLSGKRHRIGSGLVDFDTTLTKSKIVLQRLRSSKFEEVDVKVNTGRCN